ncbi:cation diffusion facilitator family transporter [Paenibacillus turpanensis]|uniref:cation diffusion facilitator family transporter n=1 Tax=Paenibacillus turpanensis TaxID=2689078 RepID=UPI0014076EC0|nr:cation diffusion facilitator family transporter [Paenibacillus turpanensis]
MDQYTEMKQGEKGAWLSLAAYILLTILKLYIGYAYLSEALTADGLNNATDIFVSLAVLVGLKISQKPPDHNHRYGHFRAETVASLVASFIIAAVGLQVIYLAVSKSITGVHETPDMTAAWTALACSAVMFAVYAYNSRLAAKINSGALAAAAEDNRSDALVSIGAFAGIVGAQFGMPWLDPAAAFIVGLLICKTAYRIFHDATHALTDGFDDKQLKEYKQTIEATAGVKRVADLKARTHGNQILLDVTILVDPRLTIVEGHQISDEIEKRMLQAHQISHVHIHVEPQSPMIGAKVETRS